MRWSKNITLRPFLLSPENPAELRDRAYPYADTAPPTDPADEPYIRVAPKSVTFVGQRGPVQAVGVNGCQIDDILTFVLGTLQTFNKVFPSRENSLAITKLQECLHWLDARRQEREERGVEGFNKA